ncbi:hypothetical protein OPV22_033612 [Ensete ventricosum]|uniref:SHSP domain-containing protein n=1 Tax=Ensete ventricosum TaxID=4639 RepID=A0AAV8P3I0_ENSVE|nr:hypothetical protein OPV22_033612 [Ensete ventricosum]
MEAASGSRTYSECNPKCEWTEVNEFDVLKVDLSGLGFKKEELKVLVDTSRKLTIRGERAIRDGQRRRFLRSFQLPKHCNIEQLRAKFDQEILYVVLPKPVGARDGQPTNETKQSGGVLKALSKRRRLVLTAVAAIVLVAGLGAFAAYKLKHS